MEEAKNTGNNADYAVEEHRFLPSLLPSAEEYTSLKKIKGLTLVQNSW